MDKHGVEGSALPESISRQRLLNHVQTTGPSLQHRVSTFHLQTCESSKVPGAHHLPGDLTSSQRRHAVQDFPHSLRPVIGAQIGLATMATFCLGWTVWLMLLTAATNATVNRIMNTEILDDGSFWRFIDPPPAMLAVGLSGLGIVALGYLYIITRVTIFRHREFGRWTSRSHQSIHIRRQFSNFKRQLAVVAAAPATNDPERPSSGVLVRQVAATVALDLVSVDSSYRKFAVRI
jgi:hypothetical protein